MYQDDKMMLTAVYTTFSIAAKNNDSAWSRYSAHRLGDLALSREICVTSHAARGSER